MTPLPPPTLAPTLASSLQPGVYHYKLLRGSPEDIRVKGLDLWGEGAATPAAGGRGGGAELFALHEEAPVESLTLEDGRTIKAHKVGGTTQAVVHCFTRGDVKPGLGMLPLFTAVPRVACRHSCLHLAAALACCQSAHAYAYTHAQTHVAGVMDSPC